MPSNSFKDRGARNALKSHINSSPAGTGVVAASAGNHALALAWNGQDLGVPVTVLMPTGAPLAKVSKCRAFGANVVMFGDTIADAQAEAQTNAKYKDLAYINGFDDHAIIAGAGTMGLEIVNQVLANQLNSNLFEREFPRIAAFFFIPFYALPAKIKPSCVTT